MNILHVETGRNLYGGALQEIYLMQGLARSGWTNYLICVRDGAIREKALSCATVSAIPSAGDLDARMLMEMVRVIRRYQPKILHVHCRRGGDYFGSLAARLTRTPAVITRRVDNPESRMGAKLKYGGYDAVVAISSGVRNALGSAGLDPGRIELIPDAVDSGRFTEGCRRQWLKEALGYGSQYKLVGVIAQLIPRKGHGHLIRAIPSILSEEPQARFLLLGQGPLRAELERQCRRQGVEEVVRFAGFREDIDRILPCLDLVVHPAEMEGMGVALLESAAAGVPVVASRVGGIPEVVRHGRTGYLVDAGRPDQIARRVVQLLNDPLTARRFGDNAKRLALAEFSIDKMVSAYIRVYRSLSDQKSYSKRSMSAL